MANENIVTNIVANADFSNLIADVHKVTASLSKLQQELAGTNKMLSKQVAVMNSAFSDTLRSTGQFSTHFVSLTSDVDKFGKNLDSGKLKLKEYYRAFQDNARQSGGLIRDLARQQVALQNAVIQPLGRNAEGMMQYNVHIPRGLDEIKNKTAIARTELQIMNKVIQDGGVQLINWGKNTQWAGRQLTVGLTLPLAAFGKAAADAFKMADQELTRLTKVYGGLSQKSSEDLARIRSDVSATAKELSSAYGVSFTETISLAADIAATGKEGNELLGSVKETSRLAVLGEVDRQEAMKATLAIQSAFKQNTEELSKSINFLNAVENQTSTTLNDLVEAIPKAGPIVKGLGGDVKDLALYLTAMREGGINATEGANALKSGLASLINPTKVAVGRFKEFGIDLLGIVNNNAGNVTATLMDLQSALERLDPLQKQQAIEQLFGKFQFSRMNALFENLGKQGSQTLQVLDLMKASAGDLESLAGRELAQVTESASGRYKRALESLKADLAKVGEEFLNIGTFMINAIDKIVNFITKLPDPIKKLLTAAGAFTAIAGPIIMLTGVLANFFGYIIKGVMHFKALFKGAEGWKLLTPEILAAQKAGDLVEKTFYSDAKAAAVLKTAITNLISEFSILQTKVNQGVSVAPGLSNIGATMVGAGQRVVDPKNPLVGPKYSRASTHMVPRADMTPEQRMQQTIFGLVPGSIPVNQRIGPTPQIYMNEGLPNVEGLTSVKGVSTGVVSSEAAKWHTMMATLGMQSKAEVLELKKQIAATGVMSKDFMQTFDDILPLVTKITDNAARESAAIVAQLKAGALNVEQAKAKIVALNLQTEQMITQTVSQQATSMGRTFNPTVVPTLNQPVVDATGRSNMRELFKKSKTKDFIDKVAGLLGVRTSGAGYNIQTTIPKRFNTGNIVPGTGNMDTVPAMLTPGEFVVNARATAENLPLLMAINGPGSQGTFLNKGSSDPLQSSHLIRPSNLIKYKSIEKALAAQGLDTSSIQGLTFQGYGMGTSAALPKSINQGMATVWEKDGARAQAAARQMKLPPYLIGDVVPLTNADAAKLSRFYQGMGNREVAAFFADNKYQENLMKRIAITNAKARGTSATKDFSSLIKEEYSRVQKSFAGKEDHHQITRGLINEFIVDPKTGKFKADALEKAYVNTESQRIRVSTGKPVPFKINRGTAEYSARQASRFGGGRWTSIDPQAREFIGQQNLMGMNRNPYSPLNPMNYSMPSHGKKAFLGMPLPKLPGGGWKNPRYTGGSMWHTYQRFNKGGMVGGVRGYNDGGYVKAMIGSTAGYMGGSALGQAIGGDTGSMIGGIAGSIAVPALMNGSGRAAEAGATKINLFKRAAQALVTLPGPVKVIAGLIAVGGILKKVTDEIKEHEATVSLGFGQTGKTAEKLGLQYRSLSDQLSDFAEKSKIASANIESTYASIKTAGIPGLTLTIKELKELKETVKADLPEFVKIFDVAKANEVVQKAEQLKAQFVAGGMSVEEANKKIFAMISVSNKANQAVSAIASEGFSKIKDKASAASSTIETFNKLLSSGNTDQLDEAFSSVLTSIEAAGKSLTGTKDKLGNTIDSAETLKSQFDMINQSQLKNVELGDKGVEALAKQDPILGAILDKADTLASAYAKIKLYLDGVDINLQGISSEMSVQIALAIEKQRASLMSMEGSYGSIVKKIKTYTDIAKSDSVVKNQQKIQMSLEDQIKKHEKIIDQIKKEADERVDSLNRQNDAETFNLDIKQKQLEYQDRVASGDLSGAAQSQIEIQRLTKGRQKDILVQGIRDRESSDIEKQQIIIDALNDKGKNAQTIIDSANKKADEALKKAGELQTLLADVVAATINANNGLTEVERKNVFNLENRLSKLGIQLDLLTTQSNFTYGSGNPLNTKSMPGLQGIEGIAKSSITTALSPDGKTLNVTDSKVLAFLTKNGSKPYGVDNFGIKTAFSGSGRGAVVSSSTADAAALTAAGISYKSGTVFEDNSGKKWKIDGAPDRSGRIKISPVTGKYLGGLISGPGTGTSDSIMAMSQGGPIMVSNGEYIINAESVKNLGVPFLDSINKMAAGGMVGGRYDVPSSQKVAVMGYSGGGSVKHYNVGGLVINTQPGQNPREIATIAINMMNAENSLAMKSQGMPKVIGG